MYRSKGLKNQIQCQTAVVRSLSLSPWSCRLRTRSWRTPRREVGANSSWTSLSIPRWDGGNRRLVRWRRAATESTTRTDRFWETAETEKLMRCVTQDVVVVIVVATCCCRLRTLTYICLRRWHAVDVTDLHITLSDTTKQPSNTTIKTFMGTH